MNLGRIVSAMLLGCAFAVTSTAEDGAQPESEEPDADFLEFLGSWGQDADEWQEFFDSYSEPTDASGRDTDENFDRRAHHDAD